MGKRIVVRDRGKNEKAYIIPDGMTDPELFQILYDKGWEQDPKGKFFTLRGSEEGDLIARITQDSQEFPLGQLPDLPDKE